MPFVLITSVQYISTELKPTKIVFLIAHLGENKHEHA